MKARGDLMNIRPSAAIRQNYNEIADLCRKSSEPVFLTKNGEGDLVVMDIESFNRREKMLKLREELLAVKRGDFTDGITIKKEFYDLLDQREEKLQEAIKQTKLPEKPDYKKINEFVMSVNERIVKGEI